MKKQAKSRRFLNAALAAVLACGLMVPAGAMAWADNGNGAASADANAFDAEVGDRAAASIGGADGTPVIAPAVRQTAQAYVAAVPLAAPVAAPYADGPWVTPTGCQFQIQGGTDGTDFNFSGTILHIKKSTPLVIKMAAGVTSTAHSIQIDAGVKADITLAGVTISSATAPIDLITNADEDGDGVKIKNGAAIVNKTMLYLTLADNTTNTLTCTDRTKTGSPAVRCGWGSILVIDDSVTNVVAGGSKFNLDDIVTPENGMVPRDLTLLDGTTLKKGDSLTYMQATTPGVLNATSGGHSAGIGSGPTENAGTLIFNGGKIVARVCDYGTYGWGPGNGAAIGSGSGGSGTIMIFNGGDIDAKAGSCGAGIGSALGYYSADHRATARPDAIVVPTNEADSFGYSFDAIPNNVSWLCCNKSGARPACPAGVHYLGSATSTNYVSVAGDITVNGGYIYAQSGAHGNAFGQSCAHGPSSNHNHVIRVTGGTLKTSTATITSTDPPRAALGAALGYTIVTGGSLQLETKNGKPAFQGIGGTAYNTLGIEDWDDVTTYLSTNGVTQLPDSDKVQMLQINLSEDVKVGGVVPDKVAVTKWELRINNVVYDYGAPTYLEKGMAYVWVPDSATGKNVTVTMSYLNAAGEEKNIEPLYVEEVGSTSGSTLKRYIDIDTESDKLSDTQKAYFSSLKKEYDGLILAPFDISKNPINTTGFEAEGKVLNNPATVTTTYQLYDGKYGNPVGESVTGAAGTTMPADTGTYQVQFVSKQYATGTFGNSYWGHRISGWAEITPVPAVLDLQGVSWGYLNEATGEWSPINEGTSSTGIAGNRLKLNFTIRSANTTATTCAAPTGSFQVKVDGVNVGAPIALTAAEFEKSPHSTIRQDTVSAPTPEGGTANRNATIATYYLNPANRDALLALLESADSDEHKVTVEYIADKNYIQGVDKNPDNAQEEETFIVPVAPKGDVAPEDPEKVTIQETPEGDRPDPTDPADPTKPETPKNMEVVYKTVTVSYGDFYREGADPSHTFNLDLESTSSVAPVFDVSNTGVADFVYEEDGQVALAPKGDNKHTVGIEVNSCGESVLRITRQPNAFYTGIQYVITVKVTPDPTIKPKVQIRLTSRNLTALAEAAEGALGTEIPEGDISALVAAVAAVYASDTSRAALPPRPGDVMEYTVTGLNMTPGSAWQAAQLTDELGANLTFDPASVEVASNYATHSADYHLGTPDFYKDFNWDNLAWEPVAASAYTFADQTLTKAVGSVYGGQSTSVRFQATVADGTGNRPEADELPVIESTPGGSGGFGKDEKDLVPGEQAKPDEPLVFGTDIVVVGEGGTPEGEPMKPNDTNPTLSEPVLPKDPAGPDIRTTIKVDVIETEEDHDPDRILVGDTLKITATSENVALDSKLVDAIIKVTLPKGVEPKPGTLMLRDAENNTYPVPDSAYDPVTGIIAVNAGDIYGGEKATLTFDATVESTKDTREPGENGGERPDEFPIQGGTLGGTPTGEYIDTHPDGPDGPGVEPDKRTPGTVFDPGKPWSEFEGEVVTGEPGTDAEMPPVLPRNPSVDGENPDIKVEKTAKNISRDDGTTHVGDTVHYVIKLSNSKPHSIWYGAVVRDNMPKGVEPMSGTIKMTGPDGVERPVPDSAYDAATRIMGVEAGDLAGGRSATLEFDALITEDATGVDIGNVGTAYGTKPGDANPGEVGSGEVRPTPGEPFQPDEGWGNWEHNKDSVSNNNPVYPDGASGVGGVLPADGSGAGPGGGSGDGSDNGLGGLLAQTGTKGSTILSKTGDENSLGLFAGAALASGALMLLLIAAHRARRREQ